MQAGSAGSVPALKEADAKAMLSTIEQTGRQAFAEMRRLVGEIPRVLARLASAGLDVDLEKEGTQREVPAGVELSAYRIVQEALTNTLRHAARRPSPPRVPAAPRDAPSVMP